MELTQRQIDELGRTLKQRFDALVNEARAGAVRSRETAPHVLEQAVGDTGDRALAVTLTSLEDAEFSRDVRELNNVEAALKRIDEGAYGICTDCGTDIALDRLRANPAALRCIDCQKVFERTFAQTARTTP